MACVLTPTRRIALIIASIISVALGLALVFVLVTPQRVGQLRTPELLGVLALLILPGVTVWSLRRSRRAAASAIFAQRAQRLASPAPIAAAAQPVVAQTEEPTPAARSTSKATAQPSTMHTAKSQKDWQIIIPVQGLKAHKASGNNGLNAMPAASPRSGSIPSQGQRGASDPRTNKAPTRGQSPRSTPPKKDAKRSPAGSGSFRAAS